MENEHNEQKQDAMENEHTKEKEYAKGKEYAKFPPIDPDIWIEIVSLLPQSHLKTYWEDLASIKELPKDDPIVVAILAMGIMTIVAREVPAELAGLLANVREIFHDDTFLKKVEFQLGEVKGECNAAVRELRPFREDLQSTLRSLAEHRKKLAVLVTEQVEKEVAARSFFDRHPLAIAYTAGGSMVVGTLLGYLLSHGI